MWKTILLCLYFLFFTELATFNRLKVGFYERYFTSKGITFMRKAPSLFSSAALRVGGKKFFKSFRRATGITYVCSFCVSRHQKPSRFFFFSEKKKVWRIANFWRNFLFLVKLEFLIILFSFKALKKCLKTFILFFCKAFHSFSKNLMKKGNLRSNNRRP